MSSSREQHHLYKYYVDTQAVSDLTRRTLVLVLAGGEGSRLRNLTKWRAKPAVPFGGKYRIIDFALSNCINSGIGKIHILTQYKSHSLLRHLTVLSRGPSEIPGYDERDRDDDRHGDRRGGRRP
mgnify:CR=1 FL=1